ncbi:PIN domain-containing protein [Candidatus Woesearchaeota archaeon]|nr:PIN domain-containing protein [Candidatus Woesearchaeota archaeon]
MKFYFDSNVFITAALDGSFSEKARELLQKTRIGTFGKVVTSSLTCDEVFWGVKKLRGESHAIAVTEAMLLTPNLEVAPVDRNIVWLGLNLIKEYHLDPRDALHAACALENKASIIVSEDTDFNKIKELKRKGLSEIR